MWAISERRDYALDIARINMFIGLLPPFGFILLLDRTSVLL
jgi:hypothetical protein